MGEVEPYMNSEEGLRQDISQERGTIHSERSIHNESTDIVELAVIM
jgi:hypothetical protein